MEIIWSLDPGTYGFSTFLSILGVISPIYWEFKKHAIFPWVFWGSIPVCIPMVDGCLRGIHGFLALTRMPGWKTVGWVP